MTYANCLKNRRWTNIATTNAPTISQKSSGVTKSISPRNRFSISADSTLGVFCVMRIRAAIEETKANPRTASFGIFLPVSRRDMITTVTSVTTSDPMVCGMCMNGRKVIANPRTDTCVSTAPRKITRFATIYTPRNAHTVPTRMLPYSA